MLDLLIKQYALTTNTNSFLNLLRLNSMYRFLLRNIGNILLPYYFTFRNKNSNFSLFSSKSNDSNKKNDDLLIVSLTSFPARIDKLWMVIESIFMQTHKPDKIILWISKEQFDSIEILPVKLLKQCKRGLEIYLKEDDLGPHKKYFYTLEKHPKATFITIDDDVLYPSNFIEIMLHYHNRYPKSIITNRSKQISVKEGLIEPYEKWPTLNKERINKKNIIQIGVGGVLYPPNSLSKLTVKKDLFMNACPKADDLWLFFMSNLQNTLITKTKYNVNWLPLIYSNNITLSSENRGKNLNDIQIQCIIKSLENHLDCQIRLDEKNGICWENN